MSHLLLLATEEPNGFLLSSDLNEVIWGSIAFFIVLGLLIKFGGPAVKNGLTGRTERLATELDDAAAAKADTDAAELVARATADVEASKGQALADLQADAASLALGAAEAVVNRNLDAATQTDLIETYITQVGAQS